VSECISALLRRSSQSLANGGVSFVIYTAGDHKKEPEQRGLEQAQPALTIRVARVVCFLNFRRTYRTANLQSCILYIYSTNIGTEYFKHGVYSPFFSLQNAVCFIILTYLVPVLFTFYIQSVLKLKKINSAPKG